MQYLTDCYLPSVWRLVYVRVNRDSHLAEDIVSETVLALLRELSEGKSRIRNPGAWLRTVACNRVSDHFRAVARVQHYLDEAKQLSPTADEDDSSKIEELEERREEIREVMDQIPEQQRMALEWKYLDKLSVREIAERLHTTEKAAESVLFRARQEFRQRIFVADRQKDQGHVHQKQNGATNKPPDRPPNGTAIRNGHPVANESKTAKSDTPEQSQLK